MYKLNDTKKSRELWNKYPCSQLSQGNITHIIRDGEFMGAGWWTGIQTWILEQNVIRKEIWL